MQEQLPDIAAILVDHLVHHGMEHDDATIRLWSTLIPARLMVSSVSVIRVRGGFFEDVLEGE